MTSFDELPRRQPSAPWVPMVCLSLLLGTAFIVSSDSLIRQFVVTHAAEHGFVSETALITFLRFALLAMAPILTFLQGFIFAVLLAGVTRTPRIPLTVSWFWVLLGEIPYLLAVGISYTVNGGVAGTEWVARLWARELFGVACVMCFVLLCRYFLRGVVSSSRLLVFGVITAALNGTLLMMSQGAM